MQQITKHSSDSQRRLQNGYMVHLHKVRKKGALQAFTGLLMLTIVFMISFNTTQNSPQITEKSPVEEVKEINQKVLIGSIDTNRKE